MFIPFSGGMKLLTITDRKPAELGSLVGTPGPSPGLSARGQVASPTES